MGQVQTSVLKHKWAFFFHSLFQVILDCRLKKDIQYTKANPKWHHWKTDEKRFGLTFERSEDAKAFDQAIRIAIADLTGGNLILDVMYSVNESQLSICCGI